MSNYIPHYTKKLKILRKRENHLRRLVIAGAEKEKLLSAAEEVRLARLRAIKAEEANPPGFRGSDAMDRAICWGKNIKAKISTIEGMTAESILMEFK